MLLLGPGQKRYYARQDKQPRPIWDAKLTEVMAIRHRVAHFRSLHRDDLARVTQFLRDIDNGLWHFCTSYNDPTPVLPQSNDPVLEHFLALDLLPWGRKGRWQVSAARERRSERAHHDDH